MNTPLQLPRFVRRKETGNGSNGVEPADRIAVATHPHSCRDTTRRQPESFVPVQSRS